MLVSINLTYRVLLVEVLSHASWILSISVIHKSISNTISNLLPSLHTLWCLRIVALESPQDINLILTFPHSFIFGSQVLFHCNLCVDPNNLFDLFFYSPYTVQRVNKSSCVYAIITSVASDSINITKMVIVQFSNLFFSCFHVQAPGSFVQTDVQKQHRFISFRNRTYFQFMNRVRTNDLVYRYLSNIYLAWHQIKPLVFLSPFVDLIYPM